MRKQCCFPSSILPVLALTGALALSGNVAHARVLDNFNDNSKTGWTDFTFVPGVGLPTEEGGQFAFTIPGAVMTQVNSALFWASSKTSETITLQEGRTVELRADLVKGGGNDSFAILGFVPSAAGGPGQLKGYSLAKSANEIIIAKGINQYFLDDTTPTGTVKNENVTLSLTLTGKGGAIEIIARVLDKSNNDAVLWERTVVDTPSADIMGAGSDSPAAPWLGTGNAALYLYVNFHAASVEDPYQAVFDNLEMYVTDTAVLDDFNNNTKTDWTDFTFVEGVGLPVEANGQFDFSIPGAVMQAVGSGLFSASTKTSRTFDIVEGERLVFSADVMKGGAKDSFAVLSFIPSSSGGPGQLKGYSLAKSTTDILIVKGINQYFVAASGDPAHLKQENITLVLSLTGKDGSVIIDAKALDKDANNAVLWQRTVIDTPSADVMDNGTDSPKEPFLGSGNFVLYLYADYDKNAPEDPYQAVFDNAIVSAPPQAANTAPIISEVQPAVFSSFLPASTQISFKITDDKALGNDKIQVTLNGTNYTAANGLSVTGTDTTKTATLGGLASNQNYVAVLQAEDSEGLLTKSSLYFDTFLASNLAIEIEDYNFGGGGFIDQPVPVAEGSSASNGYGLQVGVLDIDYSDTRTGPNGTDTLYRTEDPIRMAHSRDFTRAKFTAAGGSDAGVYDYDVGDIAAGEWLNYTRTFPSGTYEVYLREALANMATGDSVLELVTSDPTQSGQTTKVLGSFLGTLTGFQYRNFPLTDGTGQKKTILRLNGKTTLRLRQVTADLSDAQRLQTYMIFVSVPDPGIERAKVASVEPAPNSTVTTVAPVVRAEIQNAETQVALSSVRLLVNGTEVAATTSATASGATVSYALAPLPASGSTNTARIEFKDSDGTTISTDWSFVVTYATLDAANAQPGPGTERGLHVRVVQAPQGAALENSLARAEDQLRAGSSIEKYYETNIVDQAINYSQDGPGSADGSFPEDLVIPGLDVSANSSDDIAMEVTAYLQLAAGSYRFGVNCDDGYKLTAGASLTDTATGPLAFHNGGPANEEFDFIVPTAGFYPFRLVWYERGGGAHVEWFSVDTATSTRILINDPNNAKAIKAYVGVQAPQLTVRSSTTVNGAFTADTTAQIDTSAKKVTIPVNGPVRFYQLYGGTKLTIKSTALSGNNVVLTYE